MDTKNSNIKFHSGFHDGDTTYKEFYTVGNECGSTRYDTFEEALEAMKGKVEEYFNIKL